MALSEYETRVLESFKEQWATSNDYKEWLDKYRTSKELDQSVGSIQETRQKLTWPWLAQKALWRDISFWGTETVQKWEEWFIWPVRPDAETTETTGLTQKGTFEQFSEAGAAFPKWAVSTVKWAYEGVGDIIEWSQALSWKFWAYIWNELRQLLWKEPLTEEQKKDLPFWWDTTVSEDILRIWQGSLTTWFVTIFPYATATINSLWETEAWEKILEWLSKAIGKWWEAINKIPWLKQFRESLPEEKREEFDEFTWQLATLWLTKLFSYGAWKAKLSRVRPTEEISANILKPTARTPLDFESATRWLQQFGDLKPFKPKSFKELLLEIDKKQKADFPALEKWLIESQKNIKPIKDVSVWQALDWLELILETQWWKSFEVLRNRVKELKNKHNAEWLELIELQELKSLHTEYNNLFTELWAEKTWMSVAWLKEIRKDIKNLIEQEAEKWWFNNVKEINTKYSELADAKQFIKLQEWSLKSYLWRSGKQSFLQDFTNFVLELPIIKQWFTAPTQAAITKLWKSLREWKINPIEVQKQLPALFKELKAAWIKEWTINQIKSNINTLLDWIIIVGWKQQQTKANKDALDVLFSNS